MEQMETITGKPNESKYRVVDSSHSGYIYKNLRLRKHCEKGDGTVLRAREPGS